MLSQKASDAFISADNGEDKHLNGFRANLRLALIFILISGITGTAFLAVSGKIGYGPLAFLDNQWILLPRSMNGFTQVATPVLLLSTLFSGAMGLLTWSFAFRPEETEVGYRKVIRLSMVLGSLGYLESFMVLLTFAFEGTGSSGPTLSLNAGTPVEEAEYILGVLFLASFCIFIFMGVTWGAFMGSVETQQQLNRSEFYLVAPLLCLGIFYYPFAIAAGVVGLYALGNEKYSLDRALQKTLSAAERTGSRFQLKRRDYWIATGISLLVLVVSLAISLNLRPLYLAGTAIYESPIITSKYGLLLLAGIAVGTVIPMYCLVELFRKRAKLVLAAELVATVSAILVPSVVLSKNLLLDSGYGFPLMMIFTFALISIASSVAKLKNPPKD